MNYQKLPENVEDPKKMENEDIEIEILPSGEIMFSRATTLLTNECLYEILSQVTDEEQRKQMKQFLDGAKNIELLLGDRIMCG